MSPLYRVLVEGEAREIYYVDAEDADDAMANWHTGQHELTEVTGPHATQAEEVEG